MPPARPSADPVRDLRDGWDNHVAFACEHPHYYRLMYSPGLSNPPEAAAEAHRLLTDVLERCATAGKLRLSPQTAAQMVMAATTGGRPSKSPAATATKLGAQLRQTHPNT